MASAALQLGFCGEASEQGDFGMHLQSHVPGECLTLHRARRDKAHIRVRALDIHRPVALLTSLLGTTSSLAGV